MNMEKGVTAVIVAAGQGRRMGGGVKKQYLKIKGKPLLYYSLAAFEASAVDCIVLVVPAGDEGYCRREIVERYGFGKVRRIVAGGEERFMSVYEGLRAAAGDGAGVEADPDGMGDTIGAVTAPAGVGASIPGAGNDLPDAAASVRAGMGRLSDHQPPGHVLIHDGARPLIDQDTIQACIDAVKEHGACAVGVPVKDTLRAVDGKGLAAETVPREGLWQMQTPQCFEYAGILAAYEGLLAERGKASPSSEGAHASHGGRGNESGPAPMLPPSQRGAHASHDGRGDESGPAPMLPLSQKGAHASHDGRASAGPGRTAPQAITDDVMVWQWAYGLSEIGVRMVPGSPRNIKVTTPEDVELAAALL
ncbi:MAG: 2-C-methyl-D-erythritol 4-phosphate cytidylyltransferase [Lachnospiraceae bacterium]|jgi:2-C-methyl-D-erythritol 4-phosphate cytidylyltransferase|nr:2-C-methyl-D-erythritol 4-phosphate cytidylyltransferase [Lachnospiraceae bacterium]